MTTNAGAQEMSRAVDRLRRRRINSTDGWKRCSGCSRRSSATASTRSSSSRALDARTIERVVDKLLVEVETQLEQEGRVARRRSMPRATGSPSSGYDPKMGARPMARVIQEHVKRPLAEELLFGKLAGGGHVRVEVAAGGEGLVLTSEPEVSRARAPARELTALSRDERRCLRRARVSAARGR